MMTQETEVDSIIEGLTGVLQIGKCYLIRSVYYWTGRVVSVRGGFVELEDAAWIPVTSRFSDCVQGKTLPEEVEPVGTAFVLIRNIIDVVPWNNPLPKKQK